MSYKSLILKDLPIGYWQLAESSGTSVIDYSGCDNNGTSTGGIETIDIPLVADGSSVARVINDTKYITFSLLNSYSQESLSIPGFANTYSSDNDFSLECWIYSNITSISETTILADQSNNIGLFWDNGNIIFKLNNEKIEYTLLNLNKSLHLVATYSLDKMSLYVDGELAVSKTLSGFTFSNTSLQVQSGPTEDPEDSFILDNVAIYRYSLNSNQIYSHYSYVGYTIPYQVAIPDNGELFEFVDNQMSKTFEYSYPANKSWETFLNEDIVFNRTENYIELAKTETAVSKDVIIEDIITIPAAIPMDSSKIEWHGDNGITVETSIDGINYSGCINGGYITNFTSANFSDARILYIKITMSSSDASKYSPKLYNLYVSFYNQLIMYSRNGNSYLSRMSGYDFTLGSNKYAITSRDSRNGILSPAGSGFNINVSELKHSIEFFYTPYNFGEGKIISSIVDGDGAASNFSWILGSVISKTNIDSIYVNGVDVSSETLINNIFTLNNLHHVVINFTEPVYGAISINSSGGATSAALYQYMSLYQDLLDYNKISNHYRLYFDKARYSAESSTTTLSENSVNLYNNDWLVIQNS